MYELHQNEQYFWDDATIRHLADFVVQQFPAAPCCCLCAPMLGAELARRNHPVRNLDRDERFAGTPGFAPYDIQRPTWLGETYALIVCDPPFFNVSLSRLYKALNTLSGHSPESQPLLLAYLERRAPAVLGTFARFNLAPTACFPNYVTVQDLDRNRIQFFSNLGPTMNAHLEEEFTKH